MSRAEMIASSFDLQRRNKLCNIRDCPRIPSKKLSLFDEDRVSGKKEVIATVYLCNHHNETRIPGFMTEINREKVLGRAVTKSVSDIGFVTY